MSDISSRLILTISLVVTAVGLVDAQIGEEWDLLAVLGIIACLQLWLWLRQGATRLPVTLRPDLAQRLDMYSQKTGEPFESVLDRSVAWYDAGLYGPDIEPK